MESKEKQTLYIPLGLKTRIEIFDGIGKEKLSKSIMVTLLAAAIDAVVYFIAKNTVFFCTIFILCSFAGTVMMLTKDKTNISVVDQIKFMMRFAKSQKVYRYKYLNEWRDF